MAKVTKHYGKQEGERDDCVWGWGEKILKLQQILWNFSDSPICFKINSQIISKACDNLENIFAYGSGNPDSKDEI